MLGVGGRRSNAPNWGLQRKWKCKMHVAKPTPCQPRRMGALPLVFKCSFTFGSWCSGSSRGLCWSREDRELSTPHRGWAALAAGDGSCWGCHLFLGKVRDFLNFSYVCIFIFLFSCGWGSLMNPANMGTFWSMLGPAQRTARWES